MVITTIPLEKLIKKTRTLARIIFQCGRRLKFISMFGAPEDAYAIVVCRRGKKLRFLGLTVEITVEWLGSGLITDTVISANIIQMNNSKLKVFDL